MGWLDRKPLLTGALGATVLVALLMGLIFAIFYDNSAAAARANDPASVLNKALPKEETMQSHPSTGSYRYAAVAADDARCSTIGTDVLAKKRGSAVDATIATMLCVGVANCHSSGIGGGHFMTIYDYPNNGSKTKILATILARERAPLNATTDMFQQDANLGKTGGLAIGVPGEIMGFYTAWLKFGKMAWKDLFTPTIVMCQNGYKINRSLAKAIVTREEDIRNDNNLRELFVQPDGRLKSEGDIIVRPKLARTLGILAEDPLAFYNRSSQLAQDIVQDIEEYGGIISLDDLEKYAVYEEEPLSSTLSNGQLTVYTPTPPSSGVILQYILRVLDGFNFTKLDYVDKQKRAVAYHRIIEAFKFAFAKRSYLGDQHFVDVKQIIEELLSDELSRQTRSQINDTCSQEPGYYGGKFDVINDAGTAHASVFSPDGAAVAITSTINLLFGAKVKGSRTGIFFNDEMDDFSTPNSVNTFGVLASPANYIEPGKMMMSSMSPLIVRDSVSGEVVYVSGASGGTKIITATALVFINSLWFDLGLEEATKVQRFHHQLQPTELALDKHFDQELKSRLALKCHKFRPMPGNAVVQSIKRQLHHGDHFIIQAASDHRKGGSPDGF